MLGTGQERAREGCARAARGANPLWLREMYGFGLQAARMYPEITSNHLRAIHDEHGKYTTRTQSAIGQLMKDLKRDGVIVRTGRWVRSDRPGHHTRPLPVWKSLVYGK
jgi:hypothetical protein